MKVWTYSDYKKRLRKDNPELYKDYKKKQGRYSANILSEPFFKAFIMPFQVPFGLKYREPLFIFDDSIDYNFLLSCVASSFSSTYEFSYPSFMDAHSYEDLLPALQITVESHGVTLVKSLDSLWEPQIKRLFDIYVSESLQFYCLTFNKPKPNAVDKTHEERVEYFKKVCQEYSRKMSRSKILYEVKHSKDIENGIPEKEAIF